MRRTAALILPAILTSVGCSDSASASAERMVTDSAGIRVVELPSVTAIRDRLSVGDTPIYRVGWNDGDHEFVNIASGSLWSDGRAVVADASALHLVVLTPDGEVERTVGRRGRGPGEFSAIFTVLAIDPHTVVVQDHFGLRVTVFDGPDVVGEAGLGTVLHRILGTDRHGNFLMGPPLARTPTPTREYEGDWLSVPLLRFDAATSVADTVGWLDWDQSLAIGGNNPFASGGWATVSNGGFVTGRGDRPELRWYEGDGRLQQITRWRDDPQPVPQQMIAAWEDSQRTRFQDRGMPRAEIDSRVSTMKAAIREPLPLFGYSGSLPGLFDPAGLVADPDGNVWIAAYAPPRDQSPRRYYIMSPQGDWLGWSEMPAGFQVLAIGRDRVLGVERNAFDVQAVVAYPLEGRPAQVR